MIKKEIEYYRLLEKNKRDNTEINLDTPSSEFNSEFDYIECNHRNLNDRRDDNELYTDGCNFENKVGSSIVVYNKLRSIILHID